MDFKEILGYWNDEISKESMSGFPFGSAGQTAGSRHIDLRRDIDLSAKQKLSDMKKKSEYLVCAVYLAASSLSCCVLNDTASAVVGLTLDGYKYNAYKLVYTNEMTVREYLNDVLRKIKNTPELTLSDIVKYIQNEDVRDFCEQKMLLVNYSRNDTLLNKRAVVITASCENVSFEFEGRCYTASEAERYSDIYAMVLEMLLKSDMNSCCGQLYEQLCSKVKTIISKSGKDTSDSEDTVSSSDEVIEKVKAAWNEVLDEPVSSIDINFFDAGGYSLLIYKLSEALEKHTGKKVSFVKLMEYPTIRQLAEGISGGTDETRNRPDERIPRRAVRRRAWNNE